MEIGKDLSVIVVGPPGCGKSALSMLLQEALRRVGLDIPIEKDKEVQEYKSMDLDLISRIGPEHFQK